MAAFSKYFLSTVDHLSCSQIIHDGSCLESTIWNFTQIIEGCAKFVLPLALLPIIMKIRKLDRNVFKQSVKLFIDYFMGAWMIGSLGLSFICFSRKVFGPFSYYSVLAYPGCMGGAVATFVLAERVIYYYAHGLTAIALEISINRGDFYILKILRNSRAAITLAFMACNVVLLHGLRENASNDFYWLIQPLKRQNSYHNIYERSPIMDELTPDLRTQLKVCDHTSNCDDYVLDGVRRFLKFGLGLEVARNLIYSYGAILQRPWNVFGIFFRQMNWNLIAFLPSYVGIYRIINCLANRHHLHRNDLTSNVVHSFASFVSGLAFYLYPNVSVFSLAAITSIEVYWKLYYNRIKDTLKVIPLDKISMRKIVFPVVFGYLLHVRAFTPWLAPSLLKKIMHLTTNYKDANIYTKYHEKLFGLSPQFIL